jgi:3-deoxy-D-manno-octulosonic-acid transferase
VIQVVNAATVAAQVTALLSDRERARTIGQAGAAFARDHRGAVDRLFALLGLR